MVDEEEEPEVDRRAVLRGAGVVVTAALASSAEPLPGSTERLDNVEGVETGSPEEGPVENPKVMHDPEKGALVVDGRSERTTVLQGDEDVATVPVDEEAGRDEVVKLQTDDWQVLVAPNLDTKEKLEEEYGDSFEPDPDEDGAAAVRVVTGVPAGTETKRLDRLEPGEGFEIRADNELQQMSRLEGEEVTAELGENEGLVDQIVDGWLNRDGGIEGPTIGATVVAASRGARERVRSALGVGESGESAGDPGATGLEDDPESTGGEENGVRDLPQGEVGIEPPDIKREEGQELGRGGQG